MKNGSAVREFEKTFADYVGAKYAIALCNGTATLHTALVALGVKPGDMVAVPPLTMAATTIAVLHAGGTPRFVDVDADSWVMGDWSIAAGSAIWVDLYGMYSERWQPCSVSDAAQTLRPHNTHARFTSYSFQASKILALGEGGMLVTDDEGLATKAREFSTLGYKMAADQPRIDPAVLKDRNYDRHHGIGWNYRMSDIVAAEGLKRLANADQLKTIRYQCADMYHEVVKGCEWLTEQYVPAGWHHDYWTYAVAVNDYHRQPVLADLVVKHGGERPYSAWKVTYYETALLHLAEEGTCPVAEELQPRLLQFQTNKLKDAERNARALKKAIAELDA